MAEKAEWVCFDSESDEALSLSDLPISKEAQNINNPSSQQQQQEEEESRSSSSPSKLDDQFEFRIVSSNNNNNKNNNNNSFGEDQLCAAEDIFFHGQLLPLGPTRPVSRSDSAASLSFDSSTSVSRSLSSNSGASSSELAPHSSTSLSRISSNTLCACPSSPSPRVKSVGRNCGGRRSNGSAPPVGWGLLRLGVAMAPEMEWSDIRVRVARGGSVKNVVEKRGNAVLRLLGGCKCSPEDAVCAQEKGEGGGRRRVSSAGLRERRERMFQWLEDLSLGKEPLIKFGL